MAILPRAIYRFRANPSKSQPRPSASRSSGGPQPGRASLYGADGGWSSPAQTGTRCREMRAPRLQRRGCRQISSAYFETRLSLGWPPATQPPPHTPRQDAAGQPSDPRPPQSHGGSVHSRHKGAQHRPQSFPTPRRQAQGPPGAPIPPRPGSPITEGGRRRSLPAPTAMETGPPKCHPGSPCHGAAPAPPVPKPFLPPRGHAPHPELYPGPQVRQQQSSAKTAQLRPCQPGPWHPAHH